MSDADRTSQLSRTHRNALARVRSAQARFVWPAPPYYDFAEDLTPGGEPCLLTFGDGEKASGLLQSFAPEFEVLKFQPEKARQSVTVAFSAVRSVRLLRPVAVRRQTLPADGAMFAPSASSAPTSAACRS